MKSQAASLLVVLLAVHLTHADLSLGGLRDFLQMRSEQRAAADDVVVDAAAVFGESDDVEPLNPDQQAIPGEEMERQWNDNEPSNYEQQQLLLDEQQKQVDDENDEMIVEEKLDEKAWEAAASDDADDFLTQTRRKRRDAANRHLWWTDLANEKVVLAAKYEKPRSRDYKYHAVVVTLADGRRYLLWNEIVLAGSSPSPDRTQVTVLDASKPLVSWKQTESKTVNSSTFGDYARACKAGSNSLDAMQRMWELQ